MFKGRDGIVRFTDGDMPASRRQGDGGIDITLRATARGGTVTVQAETLLGNSDGVLPAILCFGDRAGELVPTLRVRVLTATLLSPHGDDQLAEAVELRVAGSRPRVMPLQQAL
eukprot:6180835-Pleurochrysis_carterae.AAC.1